jgi:hypothetical protein
VLGTLTVSGSFILTGNKTRFHRYYLSYESNLFLRLLFDIIYSSYIYCDFCVIFVYFAHVSRDVVSAFFPLCVARGPALWSSGQSSWLKIQRSRVRFPALPDFLRSGGSGTGSTQPRGDT